MDYSDELKVERRTIFDEFKQVGKLEGIKEGSLAVLNALANDSEFPYAGEEFAERFGFTVNEMLDWKAE